MHAGNPQITIGNVVMAQGTDPNDLVLTFNVKADGANFTGLTRITAQYQFAGGLRNNLNAIEGTVPGDVLTPATLTGGAGGNYTVTIDDGFVAYGATPSLYLMRLETAQGLLPRVRALVTTDFPANPGVLQLVSTESCAGCHGAAGQGGFHYGYPADGAGCTVCHSATNTDYPRTVDMGHGIHASKLMGGYTLSTVSGGDTWDYDVGYPTYMTNCSVCHTTPEALAAANAMPVTGPGCLGCHGSMDNFDFTGTFAHTGMNEATDCSACHFPGTTIAQGATVADYHNGATTGNGGVIWNGIDTSVVEGDKIQMTITNIVDNGTDLAISWAATYAGVAVDPCNATAGATAPVFHNRQGGNLSMLRSYAVGDDFIIGTANAPGQPNAVNVTTTNTTCTGNVATTTIPVDAAIEDGTRGMVALQGKPVVPNADPSAAAPMAVRAVTPIREWVVGTGALPAETRREIADTNDCRSCHVGSIYQHGGNRVDNVVMCAMCHNSASTEQNVRTDFYGGLTAAESYDGLVGQTYELKTMLHAIHAADPDEPVGTRPIVIYRSRGIYAFAPDVSLLQNWPGTGSQPVFGSDDGTGQPRMQTHYFTAPTYPRPISECGACHVDGFQTIPDQAKAVATTLDTGSVLWQDLTDDVLQGAGAASCVSCHQGTDARGHAYQNGWTPQAFENGRQTIIETR
jgi:OmcA/MtrC family decaheme c-type cytochrome